jgi:hypothetical protein
MMGICGYSYVSCLILLNGFVIIFCDWGKAGLYWICISLV